jgi:drug/metabolite transporter (DMT)-like permease
MSTSGLFSAYRALPANIRGMLMMLGATVSFSLMHATIRHLSEGMHPFQVAFFRNAFGLLALAPLLIRQRGAPLRTRRLPLYLLRTMLNAVGMLSFFYALAVAPLAEVTALSFLGPIFATVLGVALLGESVGLRRWIAIGLGFAGAIVILRPGFEAIGLGSALAIVASFAFGLMVMVIKRLGTTESALSITTYMVVLLAPVTLIPALFVWQWPAPGQWPWLLVMGLLGSIAHLLMSGALKLTPTNVVMPVDFARLVWMALIGYLLFSEVPTVFTWIGGAMIFGCATYIAYRESRVARNDSPGLPKKQELPKKPA